MDINLNKATNINTAIWFRADYTPYVSSTNTEFNAQYLGTATINQNNLSGNYTTAIGTTALNQGIVVDNILNQNGTNSFVDPNSRIRIERNKINNALNGIMVTNFKARPVYTYKNTITLVNSFNTGSQYGISHQNNKGDVIKANNVTGFSPTTKTNLYAIYARDNARESVTCNTTTATYEGFTFAGAANLTVWKENTMTNHSRGLHLNNTTIGTQGTITTPINNVWGTGNTWQTYVTGIDPATSLPNSNLYLSTLPTMNDASPLLNRYKTTIPISLINASGSSAINCALAPTANPNGNNGSGNSNSSGINNNPYFASGMTGNLKNIVMDAYEYSRHVSGNRKNGKLFVYTELLVDSTIYTSDSTMNAFYQQNKTMAIGNLTDAENLLAKADVLTAQNKLQVTSPTDVIEQNALRFYELYIATKYNTLDSTGFDGLTTLAKGCPETDGVAVYQARVLRNSIMDVYTQYEDNCIAESAGSRLMQPNKNEETVIEKKNFIVYPNPNNGKVFFTADNLGLTSYDVNVYDVTGKQVYSQYFADGLGIKTFQLSLPTGIYSIHLSNINVNEIYIHKLVIE